MADLYDADIMEWSEKQADALRRRAANEIDWDNTWRRKSKAWASNNGTRLSCC